MPSQTYKKLDLFQSVDYWDNISETESQRMKASPTNKPSTYLDDTKKNMNTFFKGISLILQLIIDECIILYRTAKSTSHIFDRELIEYCWTYIRKTDKTQTVHSYFSTKFSQTCKTKHEHKIIGLVLYCQLRSLFRKNCKTFKFNTNQPLHEYCLNRTIRVASKWSATQREDTKKQIHSLRCQLIHVWIPLLLLGCSKTDRNRYSTSASESLLSWVARIYCRNKSVDKCESKLDELSEKVKEYKMDRDKIVSPHLKRARKGGGYNAEFAQKTVFARSTTTISRHQFKNTANTFMSFISPTVDKLAGIPDFPCGNAITTFESIVRHSYIDVIKNKIFNTAKPCTISSDAVKKTGCLAKKITPLRISTSFECFQFAMIYFCYLSDKCSENGQILSDKLIAKSIEFGIKQFSFYASDTALSQVRNWRLLKQSKLPFAIWSIFAPDLPHCLNTAYCLGSLLLTGTKNSKGSEYSSCLISWLLSWTKKVIENIDSNEDHMLSFYDINTYNKIITAATTRFLGFVEGLESLFFVKPQRNDTTLIPDPSKLLLIIDTLEKYKPSTSSNKRTLVQDLINHYSNRYIHATLYILYCVGKKLFKPTMTFCQSAVTRNVGILTQIATDIKTYKALKTNIQKKLQQYELNLIESTMQVREELFNFNSINDLENCVMKISECNPIRPNNKFNRCKTKRNSKFLVCEEHRQKFDCPKLTAVSIQLPPDINETYQNISKYIVNIDAQKRSSDFDVFFKEWVDYSETDVF